MSECKLKQVFLYLPLSVLKPDRLLNNGRCFPMRSFGISRIDGFENIYNAVDVALETGYRCFDCDPIFDQEENLGKAFEELLPKYNLERSDVLITCKILPKDYGSSCTREAFYQSCQNLNTSYIDHYLMQWPGGDNLDPEDDENLYLRMQTWKELVKLYYSKKIKNIGVCNFTKKHLEYLKENSKVSPSIIQAEFHPKFPQLELLSYCQENNILLQAVSFKETYHPLLLTNETVVKVARAVKKTPTQVLLKWTINKGVAVISQSEKSQKIKQNFEIYDFVLEKSEMDAINSITGREKYLMNSVCVT